MLTSSLQARTGVEKSQEGVVEPRELSEYKRIQTAVRAVLSGMTLASPG